MAQRISQVVPLTVAQGAPNAHVSQAVILTNAQGAPNAHVSQVVSLVLVSTTANFPIIFAST